uniref:Uncharacterized protein n=1 Tax=Ananas comosus var. bracteatus TaxID=296719 RepID=A0A6V7QLX0_ANACO|nr:unnamed protein product [Ananas comosus var. bracteatus]
MSGEATRGAGRKRKDPDWGEPEPEKGSGSGSGSGSDSGLDQVRSGNKLLAGYLAHEFLTEGTLFGRRVEPERAGPGKWKGPDPVRGDGPVRAYADVAFLLKADGEVHVAGVVNPTQLGRWIRM